jgi:hypothetical protein
MDRLTSRQESFCRLLVEGRSQRAAYIEAGYAARGSTADEAASRLARTVKVKARLTELQKEAAQQTEITVRDLVGKLNGMFELAAATKNPSAGVSAVMGMAKLLGFLVDKQEDVTPRLPVPFPTDRKQMSIEEWQQLVGEPALRWREQERERHEHPSLHH